MRHYSANYSPDHAHQTVNDITYQVTYQVRPHLIHELEPDEAIGPSGRLVHEEAHLVATKFVQIILEDVDTG